MIQKKICMVGSFGVGKTSLIARYVQSIFSDKYLTTVGVKIDKKEVTADGQKVTLVLWDLAGKDAVTTIKPAHLRGASGYILVIDGLRKATLDMAVNLQKSVSEVLGPVPFICAVNKVDVRSEWQVLDSDLEELAGRGWQLLFSSAKTGDSVEDIFQRLASSMLKDKNEAPTSAGIAG